MSRLQLATRARSALLAGALGDAWGGPYENREAPEDAAFPESPRVSDDTWLTVATCEAIVAADGRVAPSCVAAHFRSWFVAGRLPGVGSATLKALRDLAVGGHWALSGARGECAAGAGAAMRIAPLAFVLDVALPSARTVVRDVARITHHSDEACVGALAVAAAVRLCASESRVPADLLTIVADQLPDTRVRDRIGALADSNEDIESTALRFGRSGYVVDAVPLALLVAERCAAQGMEAVIECAVSCGGDTDTIGAIAAQVVGASGCEPPGHLLRRVRDIVVVEAHIAQFASVVENRLG